MESKNPHLENFGRKVLDPFHHGNTHWVPPVPRFWGPGMMAAQTPATPIMESLYKIREDFAA